MNGLTREVLPTVLANFRGQMMHGNTQFMFRKISEIHVPGKLLTSLKLKVLGRLLWHGLFLCNFLLIFINHAILNIILTRHISSTNFHMPSSNFQYRCFLKSIFTVNQKTIDLESDAAAFHEN